METAVLKKKKNTKLSKEEKVYCRIQKLFELKTFEKREILK